MDRECFICQKLSYNIKGEDLLADLRACRIVPCKTWVRLLLCHCPINTGCGNRTAFLGVFDFHGKNSPFSWLVGVFALQIWVRFRVKLLSCVHTKFCNFFLHEYEIRHVTLAHYCLHSPQSLSFLFARDRDGCTHFRRLIAGVGANRPSLVLYFRFFHGKVRFAASGCANHLYPEGRVWIAGIFPVAPFLVGSQCSGGWSQPPPLLVLCLLYRVPDLAFSFTVRLSNQT